MSKLSCLLRMLFDSRAARKRPNPDRSREESEGDPAPTAVPQDPLLPPWRHLLDNDRSLWADAMTQSRHGPRILIANSIPNFHISTNIESLLAVALTLRGAEVHILLCNRALAACQNNKFEKNSPDTIADGTFHDLLCDTCMGRGSAFTDLGLTVHQYSQYLAESDRREINELVRLLPSAEIPGYRHQGLAVGEHAYAGCLRYYGTATLEGQARSDEVLRKYLEAALTTTKIMWRLTSRYSFLAACFHHGIYVPQGPIGEVCRAQDIRVATWNRAYRNRCFMFSHKDTYHHTMLDEPVSTWKSMKFGPEDEQAVLDYLKTRWRGSQDWIPFHVSSDESAETLVRETGVNLKQPIVGMLTNVLWDAQILYSANAFPTQLDWIKTTVAYFAHRPDLQLLIRVHPAEVRSLTASRQFVIEEIQADFPTLPANVFIIPPESNINTYAAMQHCNCAIIYGTKTGVELTSMGIPVIVAGEAWIRNKGLTIDVASQKEYSEILDGLPLAESRLTEEQVREARKYAYHFFLRRMIPLASISPTPEKKIPFEVSIKSLKELLPGVDDGLDLICDGILKGSPYNYHSEQA